MATKLDETFVEAGKKSVAHIQYILDTLANEIRRLEAYNAELEAKLTPEQIQDASSKASTKW